MKSILLLFFPIYCISQQSAQILDWETNEPVRYASIYIDNKFSISTDSIGQFTFPADKEWKFRVKALGYDDEVVKNYYETIYLQPVDNELEMVTVGSVLSKRKYKVGKARKGKMFGVEYDATKASSLKFFPNPESANSNPKYLDKLRFYSSAHDSRNIKIIVYSVADDGSPKSILNKKDIIVDIQFGINLNEVDLSAYMIPIPDDGIFVGVEYILTEQNKYYISFEHGGNRFAYEPFLFCSTNVNKLDTWYLLSSDSWKFNENYLFYAEVTITN